MRVFHHTVWIARSPETVFDFVVDFSQAPRWRHLVRKLEQIGEGPIGPGTRLRVTLDVFGDEAVHEISMVACERPTLWQHRSADKDVDGLFTYRLEAERDGTRVHLTCEVRPKSVYGWLVLPIMLVFPNKSYSEQLPHLKEILEKQAR